jgi:hypothetical protein
MRYQVQVPIGSLPVNLVLVGNKEEGKVAFVKVAPVGLILENVQQGKEVAAMFAEDEFCISNTDMETEVFNYDTIYDYKNIPLMLKWLQQQKLQQPR